MTNNTNDDLLEKTTNESPINDDTNNIEENDSIKEIEGYVDLEAQEAKIIEEENLKKEKLAKLKLQQEKDRKKIQDQYLEEKQFIQKNYEQKQEELSQKYEDLSDPILVKEYKEEQNKLNEQYYKECASNQATYKNAIENLDASYLKEEKDVLETKDNNPTYIDNVETHVDVNTYSQEIHQDINDNTFNNNSNSNSENWNSLYDTYYNQQDVITDYGVIDNNFYSATSYTIDGTNTDYYAYDIPVSKEEQERLKNYEYTNYENQNFEQIYDPQDLNNQSEDVSNTSYTSNYTIPEGETTYDNTYKESYHKHDLREQEQAFDSRFKDNMLSRKEVRERFERMSNVEGLGSIVQETKNEVLHTLSQEDSNTISMMRKTVRSSQDMFATMQAVSNLGITVEKGYRSGAVGLNAIRNTGRYFKGEELKTVASLEKNLNRRDVIRNELFGRNEATGIGRDLHGSVRSADRMVKKANSELKMLLKEEKLLAKNGITLPPKSLQKKESLIAKVNAAKEGRNVYINELGNRNFRRAAWRSFRNQLSKGNDAGFNAVVQSTDFLTNRYTRHAFMQSTRAAWKSSKAIAKSSVKVGTFVGKKAIQLSGHEAYFNTKLALWKGKVNSRKAAFLTKKNKILGELNGGIYRRASKRISGIVPSRVKGFVASGKSRIRAFIGKPMRFIKNKISIITNNKYFKILKKVVKAPGKAIQKMALGAQKIKAFFIKMAGYAVLLLFLLILGNFLIEVISGVSTSIIMVDDESDGKLDLSSYWDCLSEKDEDFRNEIESIISDNNDGPKDAVYTNGFQTNNFKEILSMAAVYLKQDFEDESTVESYLESMYDASHDYSYSVKEYKCSGCEERFYSCTTPGHKVDNSKTGGCKTMILPDSETIRLRDAKKGQTYSYQGDIYTYTGKKWVSYYCPGSHKEKYCKGHDQVYMHVNTLYFDQIFYADFGNVNIDLSSGMVGVISAKYEAGGFNPASISHYEGDQCYGVPQFSKKSGTLDTFMKWLKKTDANFYTTYFSDKKVGSEAFDYAWLQAADKEYSKFAKYQQTYVYEKIVFPLIKKIKKEKQVDLWSKRSWQELVWSTAVQYGPNTSVLDVVNANMSEEQLINTVYAQKRNTVASYFSSFSSSLQSNLKKRFEREKKDILSLVGKDLEEDKEEGTSKEDEWEGWTADNIEWCKNIYNQDWNELYAGWSDSEGSYTEYEEVDWSKIELHDGELNEKQKKIVEVATNSASYGISAPAGYCQAWVADVYWKALGGTRQSKASALIAGRTWGISNDISKIKVGATVYGHPDYSDSGRKYGHVGIYIGNGLVAHNVGGVAIDTLESWCADYLFFSWGFNSGVDISK